MKSFLELVKQRQSDRAYLSQSVEQEKLDRILDAARLAPSACNAQPWKMIVVTDEELRTQVAEAMSKSVIPINHFTVQAPVQIVVVEENSNFTSSVGSWIKKKHYPHVDLGILSAHICLAAADEGLGTCMIGWFDEDKVKKALEIPKNKRVLLVITLGYPAKETREKKRKDLSEVVSVNRY